MEWDKEELDKERKKLRDTVALRRYVLEGGLEKQLIKIKKIFLAVLIPFIALTCVFGILFFTVESCAFQNYERCLIFSPTEFVDYGLLFFGLFSFIPAIIGGYQVVSKFSEERDLSTKSLLKFIGTSLIGLIGLISEVLYPQYLIADILFGIIWIGCIVFLIFLFRWIIKRSAIKQEGS